MTSTTPRHDFYETDAQLNLSVYLRGCKPEDVSVEIKERELHLIVAGASPTELHLTQLFGAVDAEASTYKVLGSKIEVALVKKQGGRWGALIDASGQAGPSVITPISSISPSASAPRSKPTRSKWDTFTDETAPASAAAEGAAAPLKDEDDNTNASIDSFFQKLYADADEDTRRAMQKSYVESGGTSLSTNWADVGKRKVEMQPPEGMVAKKYEQ